MTHSKQSDQEFASKLVLMHIKELASRVHAINRGDFTQKQLKQIIISTQQCMINDFEND
jgi:hypothetical protein